MHFTIANYQRYFIKIASAERRNVIAGRAQKYVEMTLPGIVLRKDLLIRDGVALVKFFECFRDQHGIKIRSSYLIIIIKYDFLMIEKYIMFENYKYPLEYYK
jgi:hypothetical protein